MNHPKNAPLRSTVLSRRITGLLLALALLPAVAPANPLSVEDLFRNADIDAAKLSPDGKAVAFSTAIKGKKCLAVLDLDTGKTQEVAAHGDIEVGAFSWINNERLLYSVTYLEDSSWNWWTAYVQDGLFAVNRDGSRFKEIMATVKQQNVLFEPLVRTMREVGRYDHKKDEILVAERNHKEISVGAFRVNTVTGTAKPVDFLKDVNLSLTGDIVRFWADHNTVIRLALVKPKKIGQETYWYRDGDGKPWRKIAEQDELKPDFTPLQFDGDNKTLLIASRNGRDKSAIYKFDFDKNAIGELVYGNDDVDVDGGLDFADDTHKLLGIRYQGDQPGVHWFDKKRQGFQIAIDKLLPGQTNDVSGDDNAGGYLIHSHSDVNPGRYYFYEKETHKLRNLFVARPWIHTEDLSAQLVFHYPARDGLDIPAYLTLPKGKTSGKLPMIVLVHGGPWARDYWGFDPEVQFLASRGYVVLQPQFRASTGFGFTHFAKGWKQWGLSMQDDITDGVQNLVKQGVVDGGRVCIMGASYGGYAALMGLVKDPAQYRCAIDMFGVTDIKLQEAISDWSTDEGAEFRAYGAKELIGDLDKDSARLDAVSPLKQAGKIKAPVLMAYGDKDTRVPIAEGKQMRDALQMNGTVVEWMTLEDEGHGIHNKESNRFRFYGALDAFLKKYNPP